MQGAHGWQANAFSPETGLIYIPTQVAYFPMISDPAYKPSAVGVQPRPRFRRADDLLPEEPEPEERLRVAPRRLGSGDGEGRVER